MKLLFDTVTSLQPRCLMFWDMAAWHMACNASVAACDDPKQPREALRIRRSASMARSARIICCGGIKNNPDRCAALRSARHALSRQIQGSLQGARRLRTSARQLPDAIRLMSSRFAAYELAQMSRPRTRGLRAAREIALSTKGEDERLPTLLEVVGRAAGKIECSSGTQRIYTPPESLTMVHAIRHFRRHPRQPRSPPGRPRRRRSARGHALRLPRRCRRLQCEPARVRRDRAAVSTARW